MNDGIATPVVALALSFATASEGIGHEHWLVIALAEIGAGVLVGAIVGVVGGRLMNLTASRGWTSEGSEQIGILGIGLVAYLSAILIQGNGFIATFVGGLVFGATTHPRFIAATEFTETVGTTLSLLVWTIFGAVLLPIGVQDTPDWRPILYAVISLTIVRMLPVALALMRTHLRSDTVIVMGWFGPRGLASVVFTLLAFDQLQQAGRPIEILVSVATWTITLSVVAHGLSARPIAAWYARRLAAASGHPVELVKVTEVPERHNILGGPLRR